MILNGGQIDLMQKFPCNADLKAFMGAIHHHWALTIFSRKLYCDRSRKLFMQTGFDYW